MLCHRRCVKLPAMTRRVSGLFCIRGFIDMQSVVLTSVGLGYAMLYLMHDTSHTTPIFSSSPRPRYFALCFALCFLPFAACHSPFRHA